MSSFHEDQALHDDAGQHVSGDPFDETEQVYEDFGDQEEREDRLTIATGKCLTR